MDKWQLVYNILFKGDLSTSARLEAVRAVLDSKAFQEESQPDCVFKHANIQHGTKEGDAAGCVCDSCVR